MDNLYDYFLHYNIYTEYWCAVKRSDANQYLNGKLSDDEVVKHKNFNDLIRYLAKPQPKVETDATKSFYNR